MTAMANRTAVAGAEPLPARLAANPSLTVQIFDDLAEVEPLWRALEAEGAGSPYQRFDWVRAYVEAFTAHEPFEPRVAVLRDVADRAVMLRPLAVRQRYGCRIASMVGGKHANYHVPILGLILPPLKWSALRYGS